MSISAVVFDWGGTLTEPIEVVFELDTWGRVADHLAPDRAGDVVARLSAMEHELWERSRSDAVASNLEVLLAAIVDEFGLEIAEATLTEARGLHLETLRPHIKHDPDAVAVLEQLRADGLRVGLLSNTLWPTEFHDGLLAEAGLLDLIDARAYTSAMDVTKPHPDAFRTVLRELGVDDPARGVFVGDRPFDDIYGAQRLGMKTVLRPNPLVPDHDVTPDASISRLPELLPLVSNWRSGN